MCGVNPNPVGLCANVILKGSGGAAGAAGVNGRFFIAFGKLIIRFHRRGGKVK